VILLVLSACAGSGEGDETSDSTDAPTTTAATSSTTPTEETPEEPPAETDTEIVIAKERLSNEALDPLMSTSGGKEYMRLVFDPLIGMNREGTESSKETGIARDWVVNEDGTQVTFMLREGITFSNGDEVTSADVAFTWERMNNPEALMPNAGFITESIASVETPDPYTVVVNLTGPVAFQFIQNVSIISSGTESLIVPKNYIEEVGVEAFGTNPVGSGPYVLTSRQTGQEMVFDSRGEDHFAYGVPAFERVTLRIVPELTSRVSQLLTGEFDAIEIDRSALSQVEGDFVVKEAQMADTLFVGSASPTVSEGSPLANPSFREALSLAIDREGILEALLLGFGKTHGNLNALAVPGIEELPADAYDLAAAESALAESGVDTSTLNLTFHVWDYRGWNTAEIGQVIQQSWDSIGIPTNLLHRDYSTVRGEWVARELPPDSIVLFVLPGSPFPSGSMAALIPCEGPLTIACDPALDAAAATATAATTEDAWYAALNEIERLSHEMRVHMTVVEAGPLVALAPNIADAYFPGQSYADINIPSLVFGS
jgi:peptide/nickel transport system substrate-binding protein